MHRQYSVVQPALKVLEMDDIGINMDYIEKVAKRRGPYYIREKKMDYIMKQNKMI